MLGSATILVSGWHDRQAKKEARLDEAWQAWLPQFAMYPAAAPWASRYRSKAYLISKWAKLLLTMSLEQRLEIANPMMQPQLIWHVERVVQRPRGHTAAMLEGCLVLVGLLNYRHLAPSVEKLLKNPYPPVVYAAAVALVRMDAQQFERVWQIIPINDISKTALMALFVAGNPQDVDDAIQARIERSTAKEASQLLTMWGQLPSGAAQRYARGLLEQGKAESWLLSAALRMQFNPACLPVVRAYLKHPDWSVRLNAVKVMGTIGNEEDITILQELTAHPNWWLRTRAKEQLKELNSRGAQFVQHL